VCKHHSRQKVFIAPIIAILLLCLLSSSLPFSTHSGTVSAADSVFYDFVTEASSASWSSAAGNLPFPGSDSDSRGFALYRDNWQLEDNNTWPRALETHPQWVSKGWIMGVYPQVTVPSNAELKVTVGFFKGATASDGVTFEVKFEEFLGLQMAPKVYPIFSHVATYDSKLDSIVEELSSIEGKTGNFVLSVNAGQSSGQDWAAWAEAKIETAPPGLPDLVATGVESLPSRIEVGQRICLKPLIENAGATSSGPCAVGFYVDGEKLVTVDISAIPAGHSLRDVEEVCAYWTPAETGPHLVSFITDVDEVVDESDEGNNEIEIELDVLAASEDTEPPEVTITYSPENPTDTDCITFNIHVVDPSGIGGLTLYVAGSSVTPTLTSEAEEEADFSYTAGPYEPGLYHYYVEAWDTLSNQKWTEPEQFRVGYAVPFTLDITISPARPTSEDIVTFTAVASSPYGVSNIRIFLNLRKIKECSDTATCSLARGPFREGETVIYSADARDGLGNYIALDNRSFTVGVAPKPDLIITDIWNDGDTIKYTIANIGVTPSTESHTKLVIDGGPAPSAFQHTPPLDPGREIEGAFTDFHWSCSPPEEVIAVIADGNEEIEELDDRNNLRRERWDCPEHPGDTRYPKDVLTMYSEREVFLVSDEDWRNALQLVPLSVWEAPIQAYPLLIYHREGYNFDVDSTIHFLQQYNPTHLTIFGDTPGALDSLLVASAPGAGLSLSQITRQPLTTDAYLSYWWRNYNILVISQDDYATGLMASVFASYINAPLLFDGHFDYNVIKDKSVYVIGNLGASSMSRVKRNAYVIEAYTLPELTDEYIELTNTDKVTLVNSSDFGIYLGEDLTPERGGGVIHCPFRGISLAAPYLASAREEVIISVNNGALPANPDCNDVPGLTNNFNDVDQFVEDKVSTIFSTTPDYLTIVASPKAIVDSLYRDCYHGWHMRTAVDWKYGSADNDDPGMKVGRIYGVTISDASAYIAREIFYSEIFDNTYALNEYTGLCIGHSFERYYNNMRKIKQKTTTAGYETRCFTGEDREGCVTELKPSFDNYSERQFIVYGDHGAPWEWSGTMSTSEVPWLDVSYVFAHACLTNDFWEGGGGKNVLGANIIRRGAVCYFGATGVSYGDNSETKALEHMTGSHRYNLGELNNWLIEDFSVYKRDYMMLGDPLFVPVFEEVDWD
jgi:hypothetical protein